MRALMIQMPCKSPLLQHPLTKCHIITLREMQKIKMSTNTPNQNEYNTKNTLASKPTSAVGLARPTPAMGLARPTLVVGQKSMPAVGLARPMPAVVWLDPLAWVSSAVTRAARLKTRF